MSKGTNKNSTVASAVDSDQFFLKLADQFAEEHNMMRVSISQDNLIITQTFRYSPH